MVSYSHREIVYHVHFSTILTVRGMSMFLFSEICTLLFLTPKGLEEDCSP